MNRARDGALLLALAAILVLLLTTRSVVVNKFEFEVPEMTQWRA